MSSNTKRLGRGLDVLLGDLSGGAVDGELKTLAIENIQRGQYQPRTQMNKESLQELADSIRSQGILQPIIVRPLGEEMFEIIAGERRWRAAQLAELAVVPVLVKEIPDEATLAIALIENIQRENLSPIEEAVGLQRLVDEFDLTHEKAAGLVGRSRVAVSNLLRLLSLSGIARDLLEQGKIEMGHARALLALPLSDQDIAAQDIFAKQLSVRQAEQLVREYDKKATSKKASPKVDANLSRLQQTLSEILGAKVSLQGQGEKGKLVINYSSLEQLDGVLEKLGYTDN
ncbi:MAG TPA: chromosome partitioning protein ParB [Gammaproteobacteria bacterium]|jgi:ParB family transcriptional regulator, chromosome partitioning protein|nr:ParB/RepB/Spo0J family partition protein [Pseudomonadota bacterium]HAY46044.1 chromosome partitioning protein ParB [Gammaproteobacteria bacterium]